MTISPDDIVRVNAEIYCEKCHRSIGAVTWDTKRERYQILPCEECVNAAYNNGVQSDIGFDNDEAEAYNEGHRDGYEECRGATF